MHIGGRNYYKGDLIMGVIKSNGESSYRRGVSQALTLAADLVQEGCSCEDLNWLVNESLQMRCERKPYPAYLDELMSRYHKRRKMSSLGSPMSGVM